VCVCRLRGCARDVKYDRNGDGTIDCCDFDISMMCGIAFRVIFIVVCVFVYRPTAGCDFDGYRIVIKYISGQRDLNITFECFSI